MFVLEAHVQVQAMDSSLYLKQHLRPEDSEQTKFVSQPGLCELQ